MSQQQTTVLRDFHNALFDKPLEPTDKFYVPYLQQAGGKGDSVAELATRISWSDSQSVNLLSGQRGSGKSTELRRLAKLLRDDHCEVFLCDMQNYLNLTTPVEITDFLISVLGTWGEQIDNQLGQNAIKDGFWERMVNFLGREVEFQDIKLGGGGLGAAVELSASLKEDPSFRRQLQKGLRGHVARLVQQAREYVAEIVEAIRVARGDPTKKVVLLVDSVEQIRGVGDDAESVYRSVEELFSGNAERLRFPLLHVVYTIPPYLTPLCPNLGSQLGGGVVCNLPSIHVRTRDGVEDPHGINISREIVSRRYPNWASVITDNQLRQAALVTGGDFRDFFRLLKDALVKANIISVNFPLDDSVMREAENQLRRDMLPIAKEDAEWLIKIGVTKTPELQSVQQLPRLARFFDTSLVLNYRNGEDWYDIHPLLRDVLN